MGGAETGGNRADLCGAVAEQVAEQGGKIAGGYFFVRFLFGSLFGFCSGVEKGCGNVEKSAISIDLY